MVEEKYKSMMRGALEGYLQRLGDPTPEPLGNYLPYDFGEIGRHQWRAMASMMVSDELQELTNIMNGWQGALRRWRVWNKVLAEYEEQQAWELRMEFVEAGARECLLMPSAVRDCIVFTATNAFHQALLALGNGYRDRLDGDPKIPGKSARFLGRGEREKQLERLLAGWSEAADFLPLVRELDDAAYRRNTFDYRNRFSHDIAPRLAVGFTRFMTRSVEQHEELVTQPDGTALLTPVPGKMAVSYSFGGTPPLDMDKAWSDSFDQYVRARRCYQRYRDVLTMAMAELPIKTESDRSGTRACG